MLVTKAQLLGNYAQAYDKNVIFTAKCSNGFPIPIDVPPLIIALLRCWPATSERDEALTMTKGKSQ